MSNLAFLGKFDADVCYATVGEVEQISVTDNQVNYNSANQTICATSG